MKKIKRITCYVFALLLFMQSFLVFSPAKAQIVPTPTNGCVHVRENGVWKIKCTANSKTISFTADGDCGTIGYKTQLWVSTVGGKKYYLFVTADPITSSQNMKVDKIAVVLTSSEYNSGISGDSGPSYWKCSPLINGEPDASIISQGATVYFKHSDYEGWGAVFSGTAGSETAEQNVLKYLANTGQSTMIPVTAYSRTAPLAANLTSCGNGKLTQPITSITGGVEKYVADIKKRWMENINPLPDGEDKTKAIAVINGMLADPNDLYSVGTDIDLFKRFYDSTYVNGDKYPPKYPNVIIGKDTTDVVYSYYAGLESSLSSRASSSNFDARTFMFMIGPVLKAGGISMYQLDTLPLWTTGGLGALTDVTIKYLVSSNISDARNIVKDQLKIYFGHLYLKNNLVFNKCLAGKGDPFAFDTVANLDKIIANVDAILESSFQDLNAFATADDGKTVCDGLKGNYIVVMLKQAFCGLLLITKQWADTAYNASMQLLATSIGVATDVTSIPTTDSADTINVGPNKASDAGDPAGGGGGGATRNSTLTSDPGMASVTFPPTVGSWTKTTYTMPSGFPDEDKIAQSLVKATYKNGEDIMVLTYQWSNKYTDAATWHSLASGAVGSAGSDTTAYTMPYLNGKVQQIAGQNAAVDNWSGKGFYKTVILFSFPTGKVIQYDVLGKGNKATEIIDKIGNGFPAPDKF